MRKFLVLLFLIPFLSGCASKQDLGGIATVSALLVSVPLVPFAEAYHVINDTEGKAKVRSEQWRMHFDPIYQKRIEIIAARNPEDDAKSKYFEQKIAFFPTMRQSDLYIGMIWGKHEIDGEKNQTVIDGDELLSSLQLLFENDPTHEEVAGHKYYSLVYDCFIEKTFVYRASFNKKMSELSGQYTPNNSTKQSAAKCESQDIQTAHASE
ncbi:hypothetical protein [Alteromonas facilis]|uniref:hypothetical protein n=1 Tax=Alteromonas facilis TaxID=2048004 RepID=UPI000C284058|nr:hypothetical protein [Alteromonas facilis]